MQVGRGERALYLQTGESWGTGYLIPQQNPAVNTYPVPASSPCVDELNRAVSTTELEAPGQVTDNETFQELRKARSLAKAVLV